jgi:phage gp45-like
MLRLSNLIRSIGNKRVEVNGLGGTTQNVLISPKGLYSKPNDEKSVAIPLSSGNNQDIVLALQKPVEMSDGDVVLTDDKSTVYISYNGESITLSAKSIIAKSELFSIDTTNATINASSLNITANTSINGNVAVNGIVAIQGSISNNGIDIGSTHIHSLVPTGETLPPDVAGVPIPPTPSTGTGGGGTDTGTGGGGTDTGTGGGGTDTGTGGGGTGSSGDTAKTIAALDNQIKSLDTKVTTLTATVTALAATVAALNGTSGIGAIRNDVADNKTKILSLLHLTQ